LSFYIYFNKKLVVKCIFYCLTAAYNFMQKCACIAEIPTKVAGGYYFIFTWFPLLVYFAISFIFLGTVVFYRVRILNIF